MMMKKSIINGSVIVILPFFWFISLGMCDESFHGGCIPSESEALLKLRSDLKDPSNRLESWDGETDCCKWYGVICDNFTGHVLQLHLRSLSVEEYYDVSDTIDYDANGTFNYQEYWKRPRLGGKISQSLTNLKHLRYLDLSNNDFGGIEIPKFLGSMASLRYLNLSGAGFGGMIPLQLGNLSNLQYLNLNGENFNYVMYVEHLDWVSSLSLEFLDLSGVNLNKAIDWLEILNKLPSLVELHLSFCQLTLQIPPLSSVNFSSLAILDLSGNFFGVMPNWISSLPSLVSLDLSVNDIPGQIPVHLQNLTLLRELYLSRNEFNSSIPNWLHSFTHLELLDLSSNELQGEIPSGIGNITMLNTLHLSYNNFHQGIPKSFENLCNLRSLSLSYVKLLQEINEVIDILTGCVSGRLESLRLSSCGLLGHLTNLLGQFKYLKRLVLSHNLITGTVPMSLGEMTSLTYLDLSFNKMNGTLPISFGRLAELKILDISYNSMEGEVSEIHFTNLTRLKSFDASGNHMILRVNPSWIPSFQLVEDLSLESWDVGPHFPTWLPYLKNLKYLDLSNSNISSTLPIWFHNFSSTLHQLNLSHNQMHGNIHNLSIDDSYMSFIDLSWNYFEGPLPYMSSRPSEINFSNNLFSGSVMKFLCNKKHKGLSTEVLILKENVLSGDMPDCWMNWKSLRVLELNSNNFSGNIPTSIGTLRDLVMLNFRNNNLYGKIPSSLKHCQRLSVLDLGENKLGGEIPSWIGEHLQGISVLNFRKNKFHGHIFKELCNMTYLRILDLADNNLNGTIPTCINNLWGMFTETGFDEGKVFLNAPTQAYLESSIIVRKGIMVEYNTTLRFVRSLDLSNNRLFGEVPKEVARLAMLQSLNLSHNFLTGTIPKDVGAMKDLESLDLSHNQFFGEIPQSMSGLTFLSHLNLSNNNLSGQIPSGPQLQSFDPSGFIGNDLCGPPLTDSCTADKATPPIIKEERGDHGNEDVVDWLYLHVSIAPGFVVGFWVVMGPLVFNRRWRHLYFEFLGRLWDNMLVWFHVNVSRFVRGHD